MSIEARIRGDIESRIRSGEWAPGTRVPTEHQLVATYRCARATANKALTRLAREGLIERRRRAGSFVAKPQIRTAVVGVPDIGALIAARGETYRWELLSVELQRRAPEGFPARSGGCWLALSGIHHAGATPFGWEERWLDLAVAPGAEGADFAATAPGAWLLAHVPWTEARHRIGAIGAGAEAARELRIDSGAPCLQIERWTWRGQDPVTCARQVFPAAHYQLVEDFTPRQ
ncbi:UTRA domain-containing protein [Sphingomonas sp.]|uniref:UTRA domain-containing protein n=1 Tax=Sphingomonas sp. TaxID=28214 RepID=UPI001EB996A9|nr:UTRA domain-containing protein [Sphingomonas sp.]MBX3593272.1 UTRA domain-containing protein [Sphingomonas sp.]